jgi:EmrB/QacA subfamily drug resistance transporter
MTTNDNPRALRLCQRVGFELHELRAGAVEEARRRKRSIPQVGGVVAKMAAEMPTTAVSGSTATLSQPRTARNVPSFQRSSVPTQDARRPAAGLSREAEANARRRPRRLRRAPCRFSPACPSGVCPFVIQAEPADRPAMTKGAEMTDISAQNRRLGWVVGLTSTAYFMVVLDALVVVTALPRMQRDLHVGLSSLQWTVNAYGIAFAAGIITAAALGDRFGRRLVFNSGLALFTLASAVCALAPSMTALVAARTVQGLGAAVVLPLSLTILTTAFPAEKRGMIVGVYGGLAGVAVALGPIVGGAVTQAIDWHWIFWINVPIGLAALLLGTRLLPESRGARERLDLAGASLVTAGVVALIWALTRANDSGWGSAEIIGSLAAGCLLLAAFIWWERRTAAPVVPLRLFATREFAIGNLTTYFLHGATFAAAFFITQEFQLARGYSPLGTGLRLLPFFATPMIVAPLAGALSDRIGRRPIMLVGLVLQALGYVWVAARGSLHTSWVELDVALLVAGVGISMALPTVPTTVLDAVAPEEMGKASGINYMAQRFGTVFAVAIASAVFAANGHLGSPAAVTAGFRPALWACVCFAVVAALSGIAISASRRETSTHAELADLPIAA